MSQGKNVVMTSGESKGRFGFHILARFEECDPNIIDNKELLLEILYKAAKNAKMNPIGDLGKQFIPQGATVVLGLEESHISIHTWPEHKTAVVDVYTCGTRISCKKAYEKLLELIPHKKIANFSQNER